MDASTPSRLAAALGRERAFRWTGSPATGVLFRTSDLYIVPFTFVWAGFTFYWEFLTVSRGGFSFASLWGAAFVLMGLYITAGRFVVDCYQRAHTAYAVDDRAAYIVRDGLWPCTITVPAAALAPIELRRRSDGSGTIIFGPRPAGRAGASVWNPAGDTAFQAVRRVDDAYRALLDIAGREQAAATASVSDTSWRA
jgi:hypothetical protein